MNVVSYYIEYDVEHTNSEKTGIIHMPCGILDAIPYIGGDLEPQGNRLREELWDIALALETELEQQTLSKI